MFGRPDLHTYRARILPRTSNLRVVPLGIPCVLPEDSIPLMALAQFIPTSHLHPPTSNNPPPLTRADPRPLARSPRYIPRPPFKPLFKTDTKDAEKNSFVVRKASVLSWDHWVLSAERFTSCIHRQIVPRIPLCKTAQPTLTSESSFHIQRPPPFTTYMCIPPSACSSSAMYPSSTV